MSHSDSLELRKDILNHPTYDSVVGKKVKRPEHCYGRLKMGLIVAAPGESINLQVLSFALYLTEFPKVKKIALANGRRRMGHRRLLREVMSTRGTVAIETGRFLEGIGESRPYWPGRDCFPENSARVYRIAEQVRKRLRGLSSNYFRHLVLLHTLPPLQEGLSLDSVRLIEVLSSIGRLVEQHCDFIAIYRNGHLDFLKNRTGGVYLNSSWKI